jgi:hypothetical protein
MQRHASWGGTKCLNFSEYSPCLSALRLTRSFPSCVLGPLDFAPFSRLMRAFSSGRHIELLGIEMLEKRPSVFGGGPFGLLPASKYFLIATPERLYLWRHEQPDGAEVPPQVTVDAENVLEPYFQKLHQEPSKIGPEAFEHLVLAWLKDIAKPDRATPDGYPSQEDASSQWLAELSRSLKEADIELNPRS